MSESSFATRLSTCLDEAGFPPKNRGRIQQLADIVGLSHRGASKWLSGETIPPLKKIPGIARKLKVSEQWLLTGDAPIFSEDNPIALANYHTREIDIYSSQDCFSDTKTPIRTMNCTLPHTGHFFGIELDTEAMSPRFPKGSIIIFENSKPKDGDFVLVRSDEFPNPIFRQLFITGSTFYLNAHNPKFDRLVLNNEQDVVGKLVQAILTFS